MLGWDRKAGSPHVGLRTTPYMTSATEGPTGDGEKRLALGFVQDNWLRGFSSLKTSCLGLNLELAGLRQRKKPTTWTNWEADLPLQQPIMGFVDSQAVFSVCFSKIKHGLAMPRQRCYMAMLPGDGCKENRKDGNIGSLCLSNFINYIRNANLIEPYQAEPTNSSKNG